MGKKKKYSKSLSKENNTIILSNEEWDKLVAQSENPPKPNQTLKDLMHEDFE